MVNSMLSTLKTKLEDPAVPLLEVFMSKEYDYMKLEGLVECQFCKLYFYKKKNSTKITCSDKCHSDRLSAIIRKLRPKKYHKCHNPECNKQTSNPKFCSRFCSALVNSNCRSKESRNKQRRTIRIRFGTLEDKKSFTIYKSLCRFRINPNDYPNIPGYSLYLKYGFFNPYLRKNGVCFDHIFSQYDGFKNNIDPNIISHIMNCQFLLVGDNSRKHKKSGITIEELLKKIETFSLNSLSTGS